MRANNIKRPNFLQVYSQTEERSSREKTWSAEIHTRPNGIGHRRLDRQTETQPLKLLVIDYLRTVRIIPPSAVGLRRLEEV